MTTDAAKHLLAENERLREALQDALDGLRLAYGMAARFADRERLGALIETLSDREGK